LSLEAKTLSCGVSWDEGNSLELLVANSFSSYSLFMFQSAVNASRGSDWAAGSTPSSNSARFAIGISPGPSAYPGIARLDNVA
jgi:hypothetical protein